LQSEVTATALARSVWLSLFETVLRRDSALDHIGPADFMRLFELANADGRNMPSHVDSEAPSLLVSL
jgi:hypothetical protein